jgi:hypothetical protein
MGNIGVAIIKASTVLQDADVERAVQALQKQVSEHVAAGWSVDATLNFIPRGASPPAGVWWLAVLDNSDQAGYFGYYDLTEEGLPLGKVFANTDMINGFNWTIISSPELLEMLIDPATGRLHMEVEVRSRATNFSVDTRREHRRVKRKQRLRSAIRPISSIIKSGG